MYTKDTIPFAVQNSIYDCVKNAVNAIVFGRYRHILTKEDAEDISIRAGEKVFDSIDRYDPRWKMSTWIGRIACNCVLSALDYKMKRLPISQEMILEDCDGEEYSPIAFSSYRGDEFEADRELLLKEFQNAVEDAAKPLREKDRRFFSMMEEDMTPREMASEVGCNANAASIRSCKIRKALKAPISEIAAEFDIHCIRLSA